MTNQEKLLAIVNVINDKKVLEESVKIKYEDMKKIKELTDKERLDFLFEYLGL